VRAFFVLPAGTSNVLCQARPEKDQAPFAITARPAPVSASSLPRFQLRTTEFPQPKVCPFSGVANPLVPTLTRGNPSEKLPARI